MTTENAKPYWRHEWQGSILTDFYSREERAAQEIFFGWQDRPRSEDAPDESIRNKEFPDDDGLYLHDPIEDELLWVQTPLSEDLVEGAKGPEVSDFLLAEPEPDPDGHVDFQIPDDNDPLLPPPETPADIEIFDEIPLEETVVAWAPPDDVEDPLLGVREIPDDIELLDEIPVEESWTLSPAPDNVEDQSGQTIFSTPEDIELFDEIPLEETWLDAPRPDDNDPLPPLPETPLDIELFDEVPLEETWTLAPLAENVEDFILGATWIPDDIEFFADVPLELTWTMGPQADDVEDPTLGDQEIPEDIESYDHVPLELTWSGTPLSEDRPEDPGLGVAEWPTDLSDYEEDRESEIPLVFFAPLPDDFHDCVHVVVAVDPVTKADAIIPFTVTVTKGASFVDADILPISSIYKKTIIGPFTLHSTPILTKRPASSGLYDGSFVTSVIAAGGAPDLYTIYADVKVGVEFCRWSSNTMAIGPCA